MAKPSFFIALFLIFTTTPTSHSNNQTDFEALLAFKKFIDNDPLRALSSWNETTTHFCSWSGVFCGIKHPERVVALSLASRGLVGSLSPHIGNLSFLRTINLLNNTFGGPIPQEIGRLRRLRRIELGNNSFVGSIPTNLSQCTNLNNLSLMYNKLTGGIALELGFLVKLQTLDLTHNMLLGTIPPLVGNLTKLTRLSLGSCGLQGEIPGSLVQLRRLQWLDLSVNNLTASVPPGLFNLSAGIEHFRLSYNQLHGTIPPFTYPKLKFFGLTSNHFTGAFPASLTNSSMVQTVGFIINEFEGDMIDLTKFSDLEVFVASCNNMKGDIHTILSSLSNCTRLRVLALDTNLFSGSLPDSIGNLSSHLSIFSVGSNQLSGTIPSSVGNLKGLTDFSAQLSNLQGPIPSHFGELDKLQSIQLSENKLTNEIPLSFGNLTLLNRLLLLGNSLSGSIPPSLGNCSNLLSLDLSRNNLTGSIPPEIMRLSSLSITLNLSHNDLTSVVPLEVGDLRNLGVLDLSHNRLSGVVPASLGSSVLLHLVNLGSNLLQGEIPNSLKALRGLEHLDLSRNNFSGKIPSFLVEFRLLYLNLSFNALQGEVPTLGVFQNGSGISLEGNHGLCGGIPILNLASCPSPFSKRKGLGIVLIPSAVGAICVALAACFYVIMYRQRKLQRVGTPVAIFKGPEFLRLSYADLMNATSGFLEANLAGAGRFGSVYKGTINGGGEDDEQITDVAVKVLNLDVRGACKSLTSECNALRGIRHRNLLRIVSVCDGIDFQGNDFKALVYEFMANGSLENWLHMHQDHNSDEQSRTLTTTQRLNIAIDVACAVEYLHFGTNSTVVHGDLKPSNVLLDQDMVAHVGDFGLAKIISSISQNLSASKGGSSSAIKGTIGYIAPEYGMIDVVSTQGDAYSYGILVLEMFTNIRPTSDAFDGYANLQDLVTNALLNRATEQVVDPFLLQELNQGSKYHDCIVSILSIAVRCSKEFPRDRMSMTEVVNELKKIRNVFLVDRSRRNVAPYPN